MFNIRSMKKLYVTGSALVALLLGGAIFLSMQGCDGDGGECLSYGENCTQSYKQDNYGTTDIQCCEGTCKEGNNGVLICRN